MSKRKKLLTGMFALIIGLSVAMPMASADDAQHHDHDQDHHQTWDNGRNHYRDAHHDRDDHHSAWNWRWDHDHYTASPYDRPSPYNRPSPYEPNYAYGAGQRRPYSRPGRAGIPANGQGMVDPRHPGLYWACDSDGHHCHWAPR